MSLSFVCKSCDNCKKEITGTIMTKEGYFLCPYCGEEQYAYDTEPISSSEAACFEELTPAGDDY